jgi:hypothetical protein
LEVSVSSRRPAWHVWMGCYACVGSGCCFPMAPKVRTTTRWTKALKDSDRCFLVIRKLTKHMSQQFWPANNQHFNCWWFLSCIPSFLHGSPCCFRIIFPFVMISQDITSFILNVDPCLLLL